MNPNRIEMKLIDRWQRDFPLVERPFALVGRSVDLEEDETIETFHRLRDAGVIARIGAVVKPHRVGMSTLAAMQVPTDRLDEVAAVVSGETLVNHNYSRTHAINLWFVIAGPHTDAVVGTIKRIERQTNLAVLDLPLVEAYHLDLGFSLTGERPRQRSASNEPSDYRPDRRDRGLLAAIEDGLPIVERPYREVASNLGIKEEEVIERLQRLTAAGVVSRFGCVVRHRVLGYTANAMAVWDVPDDMVERVARCFVSNPQVTLCYRRPRRLPDWPYNMFCMVHAKTRGDAYGVIDNLNFVAQTGLNRQAVLFSQQCYKQRGAVFSDPKRAMH
ncbi:MAG: Lrp/AsnC family transcriptional regulator [Pseudolabrys sp.]|nr:Lrp/AsnC family transcriptional regulator [Pseudolabrys sp.]MDP2298435.1 Lrp/AsnC family transcriptional regulator [Pseudolabrys sp.]